MDAADVEAFVDYLCFVAIKQDIFFLWRPLLRDANDEMVVEIAMAAGCSAIVTPNVRDFVPARRLGLAILTPGDLLLRLTGR